MWLYVLKVLLSACIIVAVTEVSKRSSLWGGVLASLPLVSLLSLIWLYAETRDTGKVIALSWGVFWLVLPSLSLFVALPLLLKRGVAFPWALISAVVIMAVAYLATSSVLKRFGVTI